VLVSGDEMEDDKMSRGESGRWEENSVRDVRGSRLGKRGIVRMCKKRRVRH
jgi:hypothetical protein